MRPDTMRRFSDVTVDTHDDRELFPVEILYGNIVIHDVLTTTVETACRRYTLAGQWAWLELPEPGETFALVCSACFVGGDHFTEARGGQDYGGSPNE